MRGYVYGVDSNVPRGRYGMSEQLDIHPTVPIVIPHGEVDDLDFTQNLRKQMISQMLKGGSLPQEAKDVANLIKVMDGMDKQKISKAKLEIEKDTADASGGIAAAAIALCNKFGIDNPYEKKNAPTEGRTPPTLDKSKLPELELMSGETDIAPRAFLDTGTAETLRPGQEPDEEE